MAGKTYVLTNIFKMLKITEIIHGNERKCKEMANSPALFTSEKLREFAERLEVCAGRIFAVQETMKEKSVEKIEIRAGKAHDRIVRDLKSMSNSVQEGLDKARWPNKPTKPDQVNAVSVRTSIYFARGKTTVWQIFLPRSEKQA